MNRLSRDCVAFALVVLVGLVFQPSAFAQPAACPNPAPVSPPVTISSQLPQDVCIPDNFGGNPIAYFDDFSWRTFIAMVWPAQQGQRGVPDNSQTVGTTGVPLVFETLKADWEVFQPNGAPPSAFNSFGGVTPCPNVQTIGFNDLVLASFTKFGNVGQAGFGNLVGPLPSQNVQYTRYLTSFNAVEFNQILNLAWYLQANLGNITFKPDSQQNNPIDVKSAWVLMAGLSHPERYYTRSAWVLDLNTGQCSQQQVGLVGLHIVTKSPTRPQWIWSTFEQMDNVPDPQAKSPLTYNDGTGTAMPAANPIPFPPPPTPPSVFNVDRVIGINDSTVGTNGQYQAALAGKGSGIWQFYRLVMTQWPLVPNSPSTNGKPNNTFPGTTTATSAFANVTMETFDQNNINSGCMSCHTITQTNSDFLWSLALNAFPSPLGTSASQPQFHTMNVDPAKLPPLLQQLRALMKAANAAPRPAPKKQPGASSPSRTTPPKTSQSAKPPAKK